MKSVIGIYDTHEKAVAAIRQLQNSDFPIKQLSIIGQGEIVDGQVRIKSVSSLAETEIGIGAAIGSILGVLTGVGVFVIPGLGVLFGSGAIIGGFIGFEAGMMGGGIIAILTSIGIEMSGTTKYDQQLKDGRFMLIIQGNQEQIDLAKNILKTNGEHIELNDH